MFDWKLL